MTLGRMSLKSHPFIYLKLSDTVPSLLEYLLDRNAYVRVQTIDAPLGKIVGKITPNLPQ
jgi:hypothetical protein